MLAKIKVSDDVMLSVVCTCFCLILGPFSLALTHMTEFKGSFVLFIIYKKSSIVSILYWLDDNSMLMNHHRHYYYYYFFAESWIGEARACKAEKE